MFSDASHAKISDGVSGMVFLSGSNHSSCPLSWSANKLKRIVRSTIAAEALSLQKRSRGCCFHACNIRGN